MIVPSETLIIPCPLILRTFDVKTQLFMEAKKEERFELRLSKSNKQKLEKAANLLGHKSLASFVTATIMEKAQNTIEKEEAILADEKDKEIFFNALMGEHEPNENLKQATREYFNNKPAQ